MTGPKILTLDMPCLDHGYKGNGQGYASVRRPTGSRCNPKVLLHRWLFEREYGYLPPVVMHLCDNPRCIEITHLAPGDWATNNKDRAAKGRSAPWVKSRQKLTAEQVIEIRERFAKRANPDPVNGVVALAREFGVDPNVIYQITSGRTYRNVA
jgi:hypothetical protein